MQSYAQDVKNELTRLPDEDIDCRRAEFVAMLNVGAKKIDGRLEFTTSNAAVARHMITLSKIFFPNVKREVATVRRKRLRKMLTYVVRFVAAGAVQNFFDTLDTIDLIKRTRFKVAYLRGAFLACGAVNRPESQYFLTFVSPTEFQAKFICQLMKKLDFTPRRYEREKKFVVWIREGDAICDLLGMLGAANAVERFEVARNLKEVRMQVNRVVNVETSTLNKIVDTAQSQLADIKLLLDNKIPLNPKFQEAVDLRLENPTCSVRELAERIGMSAPGLLYRFHMINHMANDLRLKMLRAKKSSGERRGSKKASRKN